MSTALPQIINVAGDDDTLGRIHAQATIHLQNQVAQWVASVEQAHPLNDPVTAQRVGEVIDAWWDLTPATLHQVEAMAEVYRLPKRSMATAVLGTYLRSLQRVGDYSDGCTTAATPNALLMKNRDNDPRFLGMQTLLRVSPDQGYSWLGLSTAGAPGVHSSGMNETGLAIADTHVPSRDIGPGVPRFSSMMHVLQECGSTSQAVDYLLETPQMGLGTLTIVDDSGDAAVVECGFSHSAVVDPTLTPGVIPGAVLATNHYVTPTLAFATLPPDDTSADADSQARRTTVLSSLTPQNHPHGVEEADLRALASHHVWPESGQDRDIPTSGSLCRHGGSDKPGTISTTIFSPKNRTMDVCFGTPCSAPFFRIGFHGDPTPLPPAA